MSVEMIYYDWTPDSMLEVLLPEPDNFLKIRETLTRIGIASRKEQKLYQSCHILHKQGRYFIVHFKELFALDGKESNITSNDVERRNTVAGLLQDWGLLSIVHPSKADPKVSLSQIKVVAYKEKDQWELVPKYNIGKKVTVTK
jgi:Bacteriophage translational regulator